MVIIIKQRQNHRESSTLRDAGVHVLHGIAIVHLLALLLRGGSGDSGNFHLRVYGTTQEQCGGIYIGYQIQTQGCHHRER